MPKRREKIVFKMQNVIVGPPQLLVDRSRETGSEPRVKNLAVAIQHPLIRCDAAVDMVSPRSRSPVITLKWNWLLNAATRFRTVTRFPAALEAGQVVGNRGSAPPVFAYASAFPVRCTTSLNSTEKFRHAGGESHRQPEPRRVILRRSGQACDADAEPSMP